MLQMSRTDPARDPRQEARMRAVWWLAAAILLAAAGLAAVILPEAVRGDGPRTVPEVPGRPTVQEVHAGTVRVEWDEIDGAENYDLQVFLDEWEDLPNGQIQVAQYGSGAILRNMPRLGRYYLRVRARNELGTSGWSEHVLRGGTDSVTDWQGVPAPANIEAAGPPSIGGSPRLGETLTADTSNLEDGNGLGGVRLGYQWVRSDGVTDSDIGGATHAAYRVARARLGDSIKVRVTFIDRDGFHESVTSAPVPLTSTPPSGLPVIGGTERVGGTLRADATGISDPDGLRAARFSFQWVQIEGRSYTDIDGAVGAVYTPRIADEGKRVAVRATFLDDGGFPETLTSEPTQPIGPPNRPATGKPTVTGNAAVREWLTADVSGLDDPDGLTAPTYRFQWVLVDDGSRTDIVGANRVVYSPGPADEGKRVAVRVNFNDDAAFSESRTSEPSSLIGPPNRPPSGLPLINGLPGGFYTVGQTLTADVSEISDPDGLEEAEFTFQWVRSDYGSNPVDIPGATASTYRLTAADLDRTISVRVTYTDDQGNREIRTSARTSRVKTGCDGVELISPAPVPLPVEVTSVPIVVESTATEYFVLYVRPGLDAGREFPVSVTLGEEGTTTLTEQLAPLPKEHYRVERYLIANPGDIDGDCIDDIAELADPVGFNPLNPARPILFHRGAQAIPDRRTFEALSYKGTSVPYHGYLRDLEFVKFIVLDVHSERPMLYFQNTNTYRLHDTFWTAIRAPVHQGRYLEGEVVFHPNAVAPDGSLGVYRFDYHNRGTYHFDLVSVTYELLAASMPLLENNLAYYPVTGWHNELYRQEQALYDASRVNVLLAEDINPDVPFVPLNLGQGYGYLREMSPDEQPNPRDIVIYETLPNELSRVAGIITTVPQTPLAHVNLRALQDGVPNAFIRDALDDGHDIEELIGRYVHYTVTPDGYSIRAAARTEVEAHFAASRPGEEQAPERDLTVTGITALDDIGFHDWDAFGVKAANVAELGKLDFPQGTVPDGFAVPFFFYDEFMKHNGFYDDIQEMLADPEFRSDYGTQESELKKLRKKIKKGETPQWIIDALTGMHNAFPEGQSLRYRSSTNNEDLPGFSGAGLYDSKTQDPEETQEEGIDKSIKGVWASLWNFRAFVERDIHRIDHLATAMGVLVHPNYSGELANGVAVSFDPIRGRENSFYVNTQLGEDMVTNPDAFSVPEEILLQGTGAYHVLARSNLAPRGQLLMSDAQLDQLRRHLEVIHSHFEGLYDPVVDEPFAVEIEFKITSEDVLSIKQARPWVFSAAVEDSPNGRPTGLPAISGAARVGEILTVDVSDVADPDGLDPATYSYQWTRDDGTTGSEIPGSTHSTHLLSADDAGKTIKVRVSFADGAGYVETLTSAATAVVAATVPGVPGHLRVTPHDAGALDLYWEAPASDGGSPVTGYRLQWKETTGDWEVFGDVSEETVAGTTLLVGGLTGGSEYDFRVIATNLVGHGPPSSQVTARAPHGAETPGGSEEDEPGDAAWTATLTAEQSGQYSGFSRIRPGYSTGDTGYVSVREFSLDGSVYQVKLLLEGDDETLALGLEPELATGFMLLLDGREFLSTEATVLSNDFAHIYRWDKNGLDWPGGTSVEVSLMAVSTAPGAPLHLNVFPHGRGALDAFWEPPLWDGGSPVTGYRVQWKESSGNWDDPADVTSETVSGISFTITGLTEGVEYAVRVFAVSDAGQGPPTAAATGTPTDINPPELVRPTVNGEVLVLLYDEDLDADSPPPAGAFDVRVACRCNGTKWQDESARRAVEGVSVSGDRVLLSLASAVTPEDYVVVSYTPPSEAVAQRLRDVEGNAAPGFGAVQAFNETQEAVAEVTAGNREPTGLPTISGTAQVGQTLTAVTSGIADDDGLDNVSYSYQWVRSEAGVDADIPGETAPSIELSTADEGRTVRVRVSFEDDAGNQESLTSEATAAVEPRPNSEATGAPTITGTLRVGETLTANTSGIADADGLDNVSFSYQWVRSDGDVHTDIEGATAHTYEVSGEDAGRTIRVRVSFRDDANGEEELTSAATGPVAHRPPLTVSLDGAAPGTHDGQAAFTFEIRFSEEFGISYQVLRDQAFNVTGGEVTKAQRMNKPSNISWRITVQPHGNGDVTLALPATTDCDAQGAICTKDGRKLSNSLSFIVSGTGG